MTGFETRELKCTACGAALHYEPGAAVIKCSHCGTEFAVDERAGEGYAEFTLEETAPIESPEGAEAKRRGLGKKDKKTLSIVLLVVGGFLLVSCLICFLGGLLLDYYEPEEEVSTAETLSGEERMRTYEKDSGNIWVAVFGCTLTDSVPIRHGFHNYVEGDSRYVWVGISVWNSGRSTIHVNPHQFTLSTPSGYTVSHDSVTFALTNCFQSVDLPAGANTRGWMIFVSTEEDYYRLNYERGWNRATKVIYVTEGD